MIKVKNSKYTVEGDAFELMEEVTIVVNYVATLFKEKNYVLLAKYRESVIKGLFHTSEKDYEKSLEYATIDKEKLIKKVDKINEILKEID